MIRLHRLGSTYEPFHVNPDLIATVEGHPDVVLTLTNGTKLVVAESGRRDRGHRPTLARRHHGRRHAVDLTGALKLPRVWTDYRVMSEEVITRQLVVFSLGDEEYALPIADVHEIIRYTEPRSVASSVDWVRGVISLRGKIVPVYDLASRLGCAGCDDVDEQQDRHRRGRRPSSPGVVVDDVAEVITVDADQLERIPSADEAAIDAIVKLDDRLIVLLSPAGLFGVAAEIAA